MNTTRESRARLTDGISLCARMLFYGCVFLFAALAALPWLAYRVDVLLPQLHVEISGWRTVGVVLFLCCLGMYMGCSYILSSRGRGPFVEFDPPREFVVSGPYRWSRNPIAACLLGSLLGLAIACSSTGVFVYFLLSALLAHVQVVRLEEPLLRKRFGRSYEEYLRRVPRWMPGLSRSNRH